MANTSRRMACGRVLQSFSKNRRQLTIFLLLFVLQGFFFTYHHLGTQDVVCRGPDCPTSSWLFFGSRRRALLLGDPTPLTPTNGPPNWTLAEPDTWPEVINTLYDYIEHPHASCLRSVRIGGWADFSAKHVDGYKWVCLDPPFDLVRSDRCLVYSFGVDHDWSFDDSAQLLQCEIHAFDPSIGRPDHNRSAHIHFHNMGLAGSNRSRVVAGRRWKMGTYADVVRMLGHENRTVHYLKVDIEGSEWDMLADVFANSSHLLRNVQQIGMEVHMAYGKKGKKVGLDGWKRYLDTYLQLERRGFRLFHAETNPYEPPVRMFKFSLRKTSRVYELVWINRPW